MKPKPEKKIVGSKNVSGVPSFDIKKYLIENKDMLHARAVLGILETINITDESAIEEAEQSLIGKPINLNVLLMVVSDIILCDDIVKEKIISNKNSLSAKQDRKIKPSKSELIEFKKKWSDEYYRVHAVKTDRGWKKAAQNFYGISDKTLNDIINPK